MLAGITVAALLVPQGIAYALLAGLPPVMGLYAAILPMIMYALTGSGRQTSTGPVTVDSLMLVLGLSTIATAGTGAYIALAVLLTAVIGISQLLMGALRLGFLVNFLSYPVLAGFTSGIAIITVLGQLHHILGIQQHQFPYLYEAVFDVVARADQANLATLAIGLSCILLLLGLHEAFAKGAGAVDHGRRVHGVVVRVQARSAWRRRARRGAARLAAFQRSRFRLGARSNRLLPLALTMALVGFAQTVSVGKSLGNKYGYDIDANRELSALGLANITASVSQGYACPAVWGGRR